MLGTSHNPTSRKEKATRRAGLIIIDLTTTKITKTTKTTKTTTKITTKTRIFIVNSANLSQNGPNQPHF